VNITHIGGPTALIEYGGLRILTDPTFDPAGGKYNFGLGTGSVKTAGPALGPDELGEIDLVLLTHDHHEDNLDKAGRAFLPRAKTVITTSSGADRLGGETRGLRAWQSTTVGGVKVTATPCRHGPPLSHPIVGDVIGFALDGGALWISGDTVLYDGVRAVADELTVDVAIIHVGGVQFGVTGPARYTMTGADAVELAGLIKPRVAIPLHYEGWKHFRDGRFGVERALAQAPTELRERFQWLELGVQTSISASSSEADSGR
jgi:L-ascorbate metabolism protein UlaG (beta-lactamase superfamily)